MSRKQQAHTANYEYACLFLRRFTVAREIVDHLPSVRRIIDESRFMRSVDFTPEFVETQRAKLLKEAELVHALKLLAVDHAEGKITLEQLKQLIVQAGYTFPGWNKQAKQHQVQPQQLQAA